MLAFFPLAKYLEVVKLLDDGREAWIDYQLCGARMSRMEMAVLQSQLTNKEEFNEERLLKWLGSKREVTEFQVKLKRNYVEPPAHDLDLTKMLPGSYFEERMRAATPQIDTSPAGAP